MIATDGFYSLDTNNLPWEVRTNPHLSDPIFHQVSRTEVEADAFFSKGTVGARQFRLVSRGGGHVKRRELRRRLQRFAGVQNNPISIRYMGQAS